MKRILVVSLMLLVYGFTWADDIKYLEAPLSFSNIPVKTTLEAIFLKAGVPYSIDVDLTSAGNVTLTITERQELEDVLKLILEPKNLLARKDENGIYHVKKWEDDDQNNNPHKMVTKLYALTYATAGELVRQVKGVLTKDGVISVDVGTNSLIIRDVPEVFEGVESLLRELDNENRKAKLIAVKSRLIENTVNTDTTVSMDWQYTQNNPVTIGGGTLSSTGTWFGTMYKSSNYFAGASTGTTNPSTGATTYTPITATNGFFAGPFAFTPADGSYTLNYEMYAFETSNAVNMIADPDVIVEDGTEARVQIGTREPIITTTVSDGVSSVSYTYQDVNVILTVTPQSQRDGTISVQINPQLNQIAGYVIPQADPSDKVPIIDNREIRTKLFVDNGGSIRLGGLYKDRTTFSETKVPFLGDIPLIGLLFKTTEPIVDKEDITILVSPHIVDYAPPRCQNTPWISQYEVKIEGETDVLIDWKLDLPFGANGIFSYNVYRDIQPIADLTERKPFATGVSGQSTNWVDTSRKRRGETYYYVVTAVNPSDMEQAIDPSGKPNAMITIPEK